MCIRDSATTAADLARILRYCIMESPKREEFLAITRTEAVSYTHLDVYKRQEPRYSVEDYFALPKQGDYELIEGKLVKKNVSGYRHQIIAGQIFMQFYQDIWTHCKKCEVIPAPFCVILSRADGVVVQPDLSVVCRRELLRDGGCEGAPDLVVEVLSPENKKYDLFEKPGIYSKYGVREYLSLIHI